MHEIICIYSGTSDKGPSEIGTISLQKTLVAAPCMYYFTSEIGTTSLQGTKLLDPECPLFGGYTVVSVVVGKFLSCPKGHRTTTFQEKNGW